MSDRWLIYVKGSKKKIDVYVFLKKWRNDSIERYSRILPIGGLCGIGSWRESHPKVRGSRPRLARHMVPATGGMCLGAASTGLARAQFLREQAEFLRARRVL